ncbi:GAF domain-containing protein [Jannaschia sp. LMIT008]|uniref:GAF domain-containing protein n=1 Tax=Jannaschia maritima TaxID=3032585 RepID=UPI002810C076|nr:GAF domain-containing protein [Jannaschia sp. LMIT008]
MEEYDRLKAKLQEQLGSEDDVTARMATMATMLHDSDGRFDWTGFYRVASPDRMVVGPYAGPVARVSISTDDGIVGSCLRTGTAQMVVDGSADEMRTDAGPSVRSSLALPVKDTQDDTIAVLALDSDERDAFDEVDVSGLTDILDHVFPR